MDGPPRIVHRLAVLGARGVGVPAGGIERHCEHLYPRLRAHGIEALVFVRAAHAAGSAATGVACHAVRLPALGALETLVHAFAGVLLAHGAGIRTLHVHGIGPALALPLARLLGMRAVVRHLGRDYARRKWGLLARLALRLGEQCAALFADDVVCLTDAIRNEFAAATGRTARVHVVPNGASLVGVPADAPRVPAVRRQFVAVGRCVPEKRLDLLLAAWRDADMPPDCGLTVIGGDGSGPHAAHLRRLAGAVRGIEVVGPLGAAAVSALCLRAHAAVFPSEHEGMSLALLEAGVAGCRLVASDIAANRETAREFGIYFANNDTAALAAALRQVADEPPRTAAAIEAQRARFRSRYDWDVIAGQVAGLLLPERLPVHGASA